MRLGKLLSAGEITEAAEMAEATGQEPAAEAVLPLPPVPAEAHTPDGRPAVPPAIRSGR
ncbi:MAG TPA: hypothetical protein VGM53_24975 [Streptosporangiaceae bacterium]|jgi:hypothetical protein